MTSVKEPENMIAAMTIARMRHSSALFLADMLFASQCREQLDKVEHSEDQLDSFEQQIKIFDALEQDRQAAMLRQELERATVLHKSTVAKANDAIAQSAELWSAAVSGASMALEEAVREIASQFSLNEA